MKTQETKKLNGLDTSQMFETVGAIKDQPSLARFEFRASNQWKSGGENQSEIQGFYGAGREDDSREEPFVFTAGEPPVLLGANEGANPVEYLLHALAGCVTTTIALHATARGIRIEKMSMKLDGDMDLQGLLGLDDSATVGYEQIRMNLDIEADCSDEELDNLIAFAWEHSPVCSTVRNATPVSLGRS
ncbi:MAG: osmotically inducible protein C [Gemmatimonas sp. SG8_38_2]|nr:MAG: osmotically inducible protein C [Gemmatimonas sp. SG8_38_2]